MQLELPLVGLEDPQNFRKFGIAFSIDVFIAVMLGMHLKLQFANPRARLVPHFKTAHFLVAGVLIAAAITEKFILGIFAQACPLAMPAIEFAIIVVAMGACSPQRWIAPLAIPFVLFLSFIPLLMMFMPQWIAPWMANVYWPLWLLVFCIGLAGLASFGVRIANLSEDMPGYADKIPTCLWFSSRSGQRDRQQLEAQAVARSLIWIRLRDYQFQLVFRSGGALTPWRRFWMRQMNNGLTCFVFSVIVMILPLVLLSIQRGQPLVQDPSRPQQVLWHVLLMGVVEFPILMAGSGLVGRGIRGWPQLAHESLYPVRRTEFIRDLFRSNAINIALFAVAHCIGLSLGLFLGDTHLLYIAYLPLILLATVAQYLMLHGLSMWMLSFRSTVMPMLVLSGVLSVVPLLLVTLGFHHFENSWWPLTLTVVAFAVSLLIAYGLYRLAWRRWLRIDLV
jgi:hypothetical protein